MNWFSGLDPVRQLIFGYGSYVLFGFVLLCAPVFEKVDSVSPLDHLFTSVSAVSTTGLTTVSTNDSYNFAGQAVILLLIQLGGLGYMTMGSFLMLSLSGELSPLRHRLASTTLTLPSGFDAKGFIRLLVMFTVGVEAAGAMMLYPVFAIHGEPNPVWLSVFHSVSAFCTAGFSLFNNSFESYRDNVWLNLVIILLSYAGAIGFIVMHDAWKTWRHRQLHLTLTSKVILTTTFCILIFGTYLFALDEPALRNLPPLDRWLISLFQVMTASTTVGFNTIPMSVLSNGSMFLLMLIMIIGASPSGTGGGLKTTTFTALWAEMVAVFSGRSTTTFFGKRVPEPRMRSAVAIIMFYMLTLAAGIYLLETVESGSFGDQVFECASALGTVGLSRGITGSLTSAGKWIIMCLMFMGRVGPLALGMAFFKVSLRSGDEPVSPEEDVAV